MAEHPLVVHDAISWLPIGPISNWLEIGVAVDSLTAVMLIMVTTAISAIFVYSVGYHRWNEGPGSHPEKGKPNHDGLSGLPQRVRYSSPGCEWRRRQARRQPGTSD